MKAKRRFTPRNFILLSVFITVLPILINRIGIILALCLGCHVSGDGSIRNCVVTNKLFIDIAESMIFLIYLCFFTIPVGVLMFVVGICFFVINKSKETHKPIH